MKNIDRREGRCMYVDGYCSKLEDLKTGEEICLRNHQLEKWGILPPQIKSERGLRVGASIRYVVITENNATKYYIDGEYYFPKEAWCAGGENTYREHKQYFQFMKDGEDVEADERSKCPGFYNHVKFLTSLANIREEGEIYLGTDNFGYAVGLDDQLLESQIPDAEAQLRNYIRMSTGSMLFEASLRVDFFKKTGRDGRLKLLCKITIPKWNGDLPVFANGETVYIRSGAASVKLKYNDLKSYIMNPETFIQTFKSKKYEKES